MKRLTRLELNLLIKFSEENFNMLLQLTLTGAMSIITSSQNDVLKRLYDRNIDVYRTDLQGTIVFTSDGSNISVNVKPSEYTPPDETTTTTTQQEQNTPDENSGTTYECFCG